jgi:hypothetical protein
MNTLKTTGMVGIGSPIKKHPLELESEQSSLKKMTLAGYG